MIRARVLHHACSITEQRGTNHMLTRSSVYALVAGAALSCTTMLTPAAAQQPTQSFVRTGCIKVQAQNVPAFEKLVVDTMSKTGPVAIKKNLNAGVSLLRLVLPAGSAANCDYLAVWQYDGIPPESTTEASDALFKEAGLGSYSAFLTKLYAVSEVVGMEFWSVSNQAGTSPQQGDYLQVNLMRIEPGQEGAWSELEGKLWKPVMDARAADGELRGWATYNRVMPTGTDLPYQGVTVDAFPSWDKMWRQKPLTDFVAKVHPGVQWEEMSEKTGTSREQISAELYQVVFTHHQ